jgi:hypothetical protein
VNTNEWERLWPKDVDYFSGAVRLAGGPDKAAEIMGFTRRTILKWMRDGVGNVRVYQLEALGKVSGVQIALFFHQLKPPECRTLSDSEFRDLLRAGNLGAARLKVRRRLEYLEGLLRVEAKYSRELAVEMRKERRLPALARIAKDSAALFRRAEKDIRPIRKRLAATA